jgi:hypothetical protein
MEPKVGLIFKIRIQISRFGSRTRFLIPFMCETGIDTILICFYNQNRRLFIKVKDNPTLVYTCNLDLQF